LPGIGRGFRLLAACRVPGESQLFQPQEAAVNEEAFNLEVRKFLKRFGVTAQREIEKSVATAIQRGTLKGTEVVAVKATLMIPGVLSDLHIDGEIALS
jgi:hypothetical protein